MRTIAIALTLATLAAPAAAQERDLSDIQAENRLWMQQDRTRQQLLAAERQAFAAEERARAAASVRALEGRIAPIQPAPLDPHLAAQAQATADAQARYLAESNARIRQLTLEGVRD